jgi:23S rRNA (cytidine1920-2'-O)/16S rRNA (cytidine1409-2'-O)-methyltransferase
MAGQVMVDKQTVDKAGTMIPETAAVQLKDENPFVSRGGLKLAKALERFGINLKNRKVLDVGASTGGFTDCSLKAGASLVYAVDVGYGQLAWELRTNPAVVNMERTNIRHLTKGDLSQGLPDFCCIDVAFISLRLVLPIIVQLLQAPAELVMLIKPQFEAGREQVGKKGVVQDPRVHVQVIKNVLKTAEELGFFLWNLDYSPVQGPQGNTEYLAHGFFGGGAKAGSCPPEQVVAAAQEHFK